MGVWGVSHSWDTLGGTEPRFILLMEEILHQLIGSLSHDLQGFLHPRWQDFSHQLYYCPEKWIIFLLLLPSSFLRHIFFGKHVSNQSWTKIAATVGPYDLRSSQVRQLVGIFLPFYFIRYLVVKFPYPSLLGSKLPLHISNSIQIGDGHQPNFVGVIIYPL